jgi:hypothetical protein
VQVFRRRSSGAPEVLDEDPAPSATSGSADADQRDAGPAGTSPAGTGPAGTSLGGTGRVRQNAGKGRPTPKRSEAERRRRQPYTAPTDRKAAVRQSRDKDRTARARRYAAAKRGEAWALPRKDQGPVRALARDYVDSRRRVSEYYMYAVGGLVILLFIPALRLYADYVVLAIVVVMLTEGWLVGRAVIRLARQRFPAESTRGIRWYSALRSTQIRKLRMPAPRIKPGDSF